MKEGKSLRITDVVKALAKAQSYCAYQERSQQEVRDKLYEWGLWQSAVEEIISQLILDGYLNEERFAIAYAGGKFRIKKWGKIKIIQGLKEKKVSDYCIKKALHEISSKEYLKTLKTLILAVSRKNRNFSLAFFRQQTARYAISMGFEPELVWEIINGQNKDGV